MTVSKIAKWLRSVEPVLVPMWIRAVRTSWARETTRVPTSELRQHFFLTFFDRLAECAARGDPHGMDPFAEEIVDWALQRGLDLPQVLALPLQMMQVLRQQSATLPPREEAQVWEVVGPLLTHVTVEISRVHGQRRTALHEAARAQAEPIVRGAERAGDFLACVEAMDALLGAPAAGSPDALWAALAEAALRLPGAFRATVWLPTEGGNALKAAVVRGEGARALEERSLPLGDALSPVVRAFQRGEMHRFPASEEHGGTVVLVPVAAVERAHGAILSVEFRHGEADAEGAALQTAWLTALSRAAGLGWAALLLQDEVVRLQQEMDARVAKETEALEEVNRQLERLARARSDFVNIAAHELKTPLTLLRGYTDILREEAGALQGPRLESALAGIDRGLARLDRIVADLIDLSRIEVELLQLSFEPVSPSSLVRMVLEETREWVEKRRQTVTVEGVADLPLIQGDARRLHQALLNVVSNSIKFTPDGGRITIRGRVLGAQGAVGTDFVEIVVADTGIGIAKEEQERIFEKFYRVGDVQHHSSGEYKFKGAGPGLGLPIARGIVEAHGGRIWVESEGHDEARCPGSEFHIVLPVRPETLHHQPTASAPEAAAGRAFWSPVGKGQSGQGGA
ncbi:MAG: sensor histidine kinase [Anaerolineae bacterium]